MVEITRYFPEFNASTGRYEQGQGFRTTISSSPAPQQQRNLFAAGLSAGIDEAQGIVGGAVAGAGELFGSQAVEDYGLGVVNRNDAEAAASGRADLEIAPWREGGASFLPWLGYQAAKQVPIIGGMMAAGAVGAATGAPLGAGAALVAAGSGLGFGSMNQQAAAEDGDISRGEALKSLGLSPIYGAAEAVLPGIAGRAAGVFTGAAKRAAVDAAAEGGTQAVAEAAKIGVFRGMASGVAAEGVTEGFQTALELSFRNDMTSEEKAQAIVDGALTGAAVGGVYGTAAAAAGKLTSDAQSLTNEELTQQIDTVQELNGIAGTETEQTPVTPPPVAAPETAVETAPTPEAATTEAVEPTAETPTPEPPVDTSAVERVQNWVMKQVPIPQNTDFIRNMRAETPEELMQYLYAEIFVRGKGTTNEVLGQSKRARDTAKSVNALGKRFGLLDENGEPAKPGDMTRKINKLNAEIATQKSAAVGTDAWKKLNADKKEVARLNNLKDVLDRSIKLKPKIQKVDDQYAVRLITGEMATLRYEAKGPEGRGWYDTTDRKLEMQPGERGAEAAANKLQEKALAGDGNIEYRRNMGELGEVGSVALEDVQADLSSIAGGWEGISARAVRSPADLTPEKAAQIAADGASDAYGMTDTDGSIIIFSDNLPSRESGISTIFHEGIGHRGTDFIEQRDDLFREMHRTNKDIRARAKEYTDMFPDVATTEARAVEEVLAIMSEAGPLPARMADKLVSFVRKYARKAGIKLKINNREVMAILAASHQNVIQGRTRPRKTNEIRYMRGSAAAPELNARTTDGLVNGGVERANELYNAARAQLNSGSPMNASRRQMVLGWQSLTHLAEDSTRFFGPTRAGSNRTAVHDYFDFTQMRASVKSLFSQLTNSDALELLEAGTASDRAEAKKIHDLMSYTYLRIDPSKTWNQQRWLADLDTDLRAEATSANNKYTNASENVRKIYTELGEANRAVQYSTQTTMIYDLLDSLEMLDNTNIRSHPMRVFQQKAEHHGAIDKAEKYWKQQNREYLDKIKSVISTIDAKSRANSATSSDLQDRDLLADILKVQEENYNNIETVPYFHLGRFGDFSVRFPLPMTTDETGNAVRDTDGTEEIAQELENLGFPDIQLAFGEVDHAFIKVETEAQQQQIFNRLKELVDTGVMDDSADPISQEWLKEPTNSAPAPLMESWLSRMDASLDTDPAFQQDSNLSAQENETRAKLLDKAKKNARQNFMDMLPATAGAKFLVRRNYVPGFNTNMHRAYAFRMQAAINTLANITTDPLLSKSMAQMQKEIEVAQKLPGPKHVRMTEIRNEIARRRAERPNAITHDTTDVVRAFNHVYFLGMSPAYFITNLTQVPVLLWPELSKRYGFKKSMDAIIEATPIAFKITGAMMAEAKDIGRQSGAGQGIKHLADGIITKETLERAFKDTPDQVLTDDQNGLIDFIIRIKNTGAIDIGAPAREQGRIAEGRSNTRTDTALRIAGTFGLYSEIITRMIAAISARNLAEQDSRYETAPAATPEEDIENDALRRERIDAYSGDVVNQSMFNYGVDFIGRQTGNSGIVGKPTRMFLAFQTYPFQLLEKLYREGHQFVVATGEDRAASARFLGSHLAAVGTLAGTLGLPFAGAIAAVLDGLGDLFGDEEPTDVETAYREFLADVFGKDIAEVIARGAPRAAGFDFSVRAGEQDLLPFTRFLADKRPIEDALAETGIRGLGSPFSMITNVTGGLEEMMNGNLIEGMKKAVPVSMKNMVEAYRMTDQGYVDRAGNILPMEVGAMDVLIRLLGFAPSERAEYGEAEFTQTVKTGQQRLIESRLRNKFYRAFESGDRDEQKKLLNEMRVYEQDNPGRNIRAGLGNALVSRLTGVATSTALDVPYNMTAKDLLAYPDGGPAQTFNY